MSEMTKIVSEYEPSKHKLFIEKTMSEMTKIVSEYEPGKQKLLFRKQCLK